jgi:hypothetical protein
MADRRGGARAPKITGGRSHGRNRARRTSAPAPGGAKRWRSKRSDAGRKRR